MALGMGSGAVPERKGKSANADHTELGAVGTPLVSTQVVYESPGYLRS